MHVYFIIPLEVCQRVNEMVGWTISLSIISGELHCFEYIRTPLVLLGHPNQNQQTAMLD